MARILGMNYKQVANIIMVKNNITATITPFNLLPVCRFLRLFFEVVKKSADK